MGRSRLSSSSWMRRSERRSRRPGSRCGVLNADAAIVGCCYAVCESVWRSSSPGSRCGCCHYIGAPSSPCCCQARSLSFRSLSPVFFKVSLHLLCRLHGDFNAIFSMLLPGRILFRRRQFHFSRYFLTWLLPHVDGNFSAIFFTLLSAPIHSLSHALALNLTPLCLSFLQVDSDFNAIFSTLLLSTPPQPRCTLQPTYYHTTPFAFSPAG